MEVLKLSIDLLKWDPVLSIDDAHIGNCLPMILHKRLTEIERNKLHIFYQLIYYTLLLYSDEVSPSYLL